MTFFTKARNWAYLTFEIWFYFITLGAAGLGLFVSVPLSVVTSLVSSVIASIGLSLTAVQLIYQVLVGVCAFIELGAYIYVRFFFGLLRTSISLVTGGSIDIAELARFGTRIICRFFLFILIIGSVVGALTWAPEQNAFQQTIDTAVCSTYPVLNPVLKFANRIIDFYNSIAESINLLGTILFRFLEEIFVEFVDLVWRGVVLLLRFVSDPGSALSNCGPTFLNQPYCFTSSSTDYLDQNVCIARSLFCYILDLTEFVITRVLGTFFRVFFSDQIVDFLINVGLAYVDTLLAIVDIWAGVGASTAGLGNPFAACVPGLPINPFSPASDARTCFTDRARCPVDRYVCIYWYWFRIFVGTAQNFFVDLFVPLVNFISEPFLGFPLGDLLLEFFNLIQIVLDIIRNFDALLDAVLGPVLDAIAVLNDLVFGIINDPVGTINNLFQKLIDETPLGPVLQELDFLISGLSGAISGIQATIQGIQATIDTIQDFLDNFGGGG